ncbi:MAG TPA: DinB family protein [Bryobacteraceae bacterium]|jgi:hypothetical protein
METTLSRLDKILEDVPPRLRAITEAQSMERRIEGKWCAKEVLGHLIDSASNNHQRFVRAQLAHSYEGPGYTQNEWVRTQAYAKAPWARLVDLWVSYNWHLAHVIEHMDPEALETPMRIGSGEPVTLGFVVTDYVDHMENHLRQILT